MPGDRSAIASRREAIENAKKALIHDHISYCVNRSLKAAGPAGRSALREFKLVARYL